MKLNSPYVFKNTAKASSRTTSQILLRSDSILEASSRIGMVTVILLKQTNFKNFKWKLVSFKQ